MKRTVKTDQRRRHILRVIDETFDDYLNGLVALRHGVVADLRRKLADRQDLGRPDPEQRTSRASRGSARRAHPRPKARRTR